MKNRLLTIAITTVLTALIITPLAMASTGPAPQVLNLCTIDHGRVLVSTHRNISGDETALSVGLTTGEEYCSELVGPGGIDTASSIQSEIDSYLQVLGISAATTAHKNLATEVEVGKKLVEILREWEAEEMEFYANWDNLSPGAKDTIAKEGLRRNAKIKGGLADLLVTLGKGR